MTLRWQTDRSAAALTRRGWLQAGALHVAGLGLPALLAHRSSAQAAAPPGGVFGRAKSCIVCFLFGAPAHQDVWDLKPDAPAEVRGEFQPIATNAPGLLLSEHVPRLAQIADRFALLRSVTHPDNTHTVAMHYMLTGRRHARPATNPQNAVDDFPTFGAVLQLLRGAAGGLPSGIALNAPANQVSANNHIFPGFFAGLLGPRYDPLFIGADPSAAEFRPFPAVESLPPERIAARRDLQAQLSGAAFTPAARDLRGYFEQAYALLTSSAAQQAFELAHEPPATRARYGPSPFGQAALLARRLVEAGVPLVTVNWQRDDAFWDTHNNNFPQLKDSLLPPFDAGFSALLTDLDERGLLDETLVVCFGEFGRTPKVNAAGGRDHWAPCNTVVLAGAGIRGGLVLGASDKDAAYPADFPVTPDDLAATVYAALGVPSETLLHDNQGRPIPLVLGRPVTELWGA